MITFVAVKTGTKYSEEYLFKLAAGIMKHCPVPFELLCITDRPSDVPAVWQIYDCSADGLDTWWAKMLIFAPELPARGRVIFLDLDTIILGDLGPLCALKPIFGICENWQKIYGHPTWPCKYGSCVMSFEAGSLVKEIWEPFNLDREDYIRNAGKFGDQFTIGELYPDATLLNRELPGFFVHLKKDLYFKPPKKDARVLIFGGKPKPHECDQKWVRELWQ